MVEPTPWSLTGIDEETRKLAEEAAADAGISIGEWIEQAIIASSNAARLRKTTPIKELRPRDITASSSSTSSRHPTPSSLHTRVEPIALDPRIERIIRDVPAADRDADQRPAPAADQEPSALRRFAFDAADRAVALPARTANGRARHASPQLPRQHLFARSVRYTTITILAVVAAAIITWVIWPELLDGTPETYDSVAIDRSAPPPATPPAVAPMPAAPAPLPPAAPPSNAAAPQPSTMSASSGLSASPSSSVAPSTPPVAAITSSSPAAPASSPLLPPPPETTQPAGRSETVPAALQPLLAAAQAGDARAQYDLGVDYATGRGLPRDYTAAVTWFDKAASQHLPAAQYNLAVLYQNGLGVTRDDERAVQLYRLAAAQGHARAQYNLGAAYADGRGVARDYGTARYWFEGAARGGVAQADYSLGLLYEFGLGVPTDALEARMRYRKAAELGDSDAEQRLKQLQAR